MPRQSLRIFVSSPGDALRAREVAAQVIEKLAHEYARFFSIEPYLWEYEPMLSSGHFQDSIDAPSTFDAVILILESRLGTFLPERTSLREYRGIDGRAPVTGTEWEYEDALAAARERGVPDLLVYRSGRNAEVDTWDPLSRRTALEQIEALDAFWSRHFADRGSFIAGYWKYIGLEDFAVKLEQDLRRCVQRRLEALTPAERDSRVRVWPSAPFRGLEAYELQHAPIFFGREEPIGVGLLRLITNAQEGRPFLLVLGASGSGKSSLVKAGLVPRLLVPQRVSGSAFVRRSIFRASEAHAGEDLFDALARCLTASAGKDSGLPEILGTSMPVRDFARHLREASGHPDLPFTMVLDRLGEAAVKQGRMLRYEQAKLILVVDQLEEIFTSERVQPEERKRFVELLGGLVRSGRVWVIATMRADSWYRAAETPELVQLADGQGRLDLLPPTPPEISQMIRGPAEAAAVQFETHSSTGIPLNDRIAEEAASEPGALPLISYLLDQLYVRDIEEARGSVLTYASYESLGRLKGAIATRADSVLSAQPPEVQRALRPVLFALVQISATAASVERAVARRAPLTDFPAGSQKRRLIEALLDPAARLLVAEAAGDGSSTVRLAHEALINEWQTARDHIVGSAAALKVRRRLEEHYARWRAISNEARSAARSAPAWLRAPLTAVRERLGRDQGLLTGLDLSDARHLLREYREELTPDLVEYSERSVAQNRRRRTRAIRAATTLAVVFGVLAVGALYEARVAFVQSTRATAESETSEQTTQFLLQLFQVADPNEARGNRVTAREMLDKGAEGIATELAQQPAVQARLFDTIGTAYMGLGLYAQAGPLLDRGLALRRQYPEQGPPKMTLEALNHVAELETRRANFPTAETSYREAIGLSTAARSRDLDSIRASSLHGLGTVLAQQGRYADADHSLRAALELERQLGLGSSDAAARTLQELAKVVEQSGDLQKAMALMRQAVALHRALHGTQPYPAFAEALNDLGYLEEQSDHQQAAESLFEEALAMKRRLYGDSHPEVAAGLVNLAVAANDRGDLKRAEELYQQALSMQRSLLGNVHPDVAATLNNLAFVQSDRGDLEAAVRSERESLTVYRQLFSGDHPEIARVTNRLGLWLIQQGAYVEAESDLTEALAMRERLLGPDHPDVASSLTHLAILGVARHDFPAALASADRAAEIFRKTSSADWKIAIAESVAGRALLGLGRIDEAGERLNHGVAALRNKDSTAPATYVQIAEQYQRALQERQGGARKVSSRTSARPAS